MCAYVKVVDIDRSTSGALGGESISGGHGSFGRHSWASIVGASIIVHVMVPSSYCGHSIIHLR